MDFTEKIVFEMIEAKEQSIYKITGSGDGAILFKKLHLLRIRLASVNAGYGFCLTFLIIAGSISAQLFLDWFFEADLMVRAFLLAVDFGVLSYMLYKKVFIHLLHKRDEEDLALMVEKNFPIFKDRLISTVQLLKIEPEKEGVSKALLKSLVKDTEQIARQTDFSSIVDTKPLIKIASLTTLTFLVIIALLYNNSEIIIPLLKRFALFNEEIPRKTRIEVITGNRVIGRGDSIAISARARGIIPSEGELIVIYKSGRDAKYVLERDKTDNSLFSKTLENVQDSFQYRVKIFDGVSRYHSIKVVPRPQVAFIECIEEFPQYTGLNPVRRNPGDLGLLAGSALHIKITATKEIKSGALRLAGLETSVIASVNPTNRKELNASIKIPTNKLAGFSIDLIDDFGIASKDQTFYKIDILLDKPPNVKIIYPERREELYTKLARALIGFEASDDYGLSAIKLHYRIEDNSKNLQGVIDFELGPERQTSIRRRYEWDLSKLIPPPQEGSTIEFWLEVIDCNNVTGPGAGYSERFLAKIVSEAEKRADLMNRVSEYIANLENVATEQEKLSKSLGEIILEKVKK